MCDHQLASPLGWLETKQRVLVFVKHMTIHFILEVAEVCFWLVK
jgi:hypothetical protein